VGGSPASDGPTSSQLVTCIATSLSTDQLLEQFWQIEEVPYGDSLYTKEKSQAITHFNDHFTKDKNGCYFVSGPKKNNFPPLGDSKCQDIKRYLQNEHSLQKKGKLEDFINAGKDHSDMNHSELVHVSEWSKETGVFYLPMHGVLKETSTTTKLRIVFDASVFITSAVSLNNILLTGPSLHPLLFDILIKFRTHCEGMSADISKMFREIGLQLQDRDLHQYIVREQDGNLRDYRMKRLTF